MGLLQSNKMARSVSPRQAGPISRFLHSFNILAMTIDLNCDLGEGAANDAELMPLITSANIACAAHAGDERSVHAALALAKSARVAVGAHPGYRDRQHFGRRELSLGAVELFNEISNQIEWLLRRAEVLGKAVRYVKPHGALYNQACRDVHIASPMVAAAAKWNLPILALPDSQLEELCRGRIGFIREGFADRRYRPDGSLVPRSEANAYVTDAIEAVEQAKRLIVKGGVQSLCVHGDNPSAVAFVRELRRAFEETGVEIRAFL